jgi:hypothetical protein
MKKYKIIRNIKVIDIWKTDLKESDLKDGEKVLFTSSDSATYFAEVEKNTELKQYKFIFRIGNAIIPFVRRTKNNA